MTAKEIIRGESLNVAFTKSLPGKNEMLLKTIVECIQVRHARII